MSGRLSPKPNFFVALGQFNQAVAERDLAGVTDRRLMDRLRQGQPLTHEDGNPWTAQDFFACYIGQLQMPEELRGPPDVTITQEMISDWTDGLRTSFRDLCLTMMQPANAVWAEVRVELIKNEGINADDADWAREVVAGLREPTIDETKRQYGKWGLSQQPLIKAFLTLQEKYGGDTRNLKKFLGWRQKLPEPLPGEGLESLPDPWPAVTPQRRIGFDPEAFFSLQA
jgi:hypothetical protein